MPQQQKRQTTKLTYVLRALLMHSKMNTVKLLCKTIKSVVHIKVIGTVQMLTFNALVTKSLKENTVLLFKSSDKTFPLEI